MNLWSTLINFGTKIPLNFANLRNTPNKTLSCEFGFSFYPSPSLQFFVDLHCAFGRFGEFQLSIAYYSLHFSYSTPFLLLLDFSFQNSQFVYLFFIVIVFFWFFFVGATVSVLPFQVIFSLLSFFYYYFSKVFKKPSFGVGFTRRFLIGYLFSSRHFLSYFLLFSSLLFCMT